MRGDIVTIKHVCTPGRSHDPQSEDNREQLIELTRLLGDSIAGKTCQTSRQLWQSERTDQDDHFGCPPIAADGPQLVLIMAATRVRRKRLPEPRTCLIPCLGPPIDSRYNATPVT